MFMMECAPQQIWFHVPGLDGCSILCLLNPCLCFSFPEHNPTVLSGLLYCTLHQVQLWERPVAAMGKGVLGWGHLERMFWPLEVIIIPYRIMSKKRRDKEITGQQSTDREWMHLTCLVLSWAWQSGGETWACLGRAGSSMGTRQVWEPM